MNRRQFSALSLCAVSTPGHLFAKAPEKKLQENENLRLEDAPVVLRLNGKVFRIEWLLLVMPNAVYGVDTRQPVPVVNENRVDGGKIPLIGGLFNKPLSAKTVANMREIGLAYLSGKSIVAFPDIKSVPRVPAGIPVPYPNIKRSFRPQAKFKKVRLSKPPTKEAFSKRRAQGKVFFDGKLFVFGFTGVK